MRLIVFALLSATLYSNAYWWNGSGFTYGDRYVADGQFVAETTEIEETIDLAGQFVLPPLADAHNHNLQSPFLAERFAQRYIQQGVLYGAMLCGDPSSAAQTRNYLAQVQLDMRVVGACISSSDGHPLRMAMGGSDDDAKRTPESIYDNNYIVIDTPSDINKKKTLFDEAGGDLSKLILVHHEDDSRRQNPRYFGVNGLSAEVVPPLVADLHRRGQTVVAHTESAADFALAVAAGVDWIGHLPGYHWHDGKVASDYRLTQEAVNQAAAQGTLVIPTAAVVTLFGLSQHELEKVQRLQAENLALLRQTGVTLLAGSDLFMGSVIDELLYLEQLNFSRVELLTMATQTTPRALFVERQIGALASGYEASFVTYRQSPLRDLQHLRAPQHVVKRGQHLLDH